MGAAILLCNGNQSLRSSTRPTNSLQVGCRPTSLPTMPYQNFCSTLVPGKPPNVWPGVLDTDSTNIYAVRVGYWGELTVNPV